jgi:hypothetical protein
MNILKKTVLFFCNKDSWISTVISTFCTTVFIFLGGYIAFITSIQPVWFKLALVGFLAIVLYVSCGLIERYVFKKLGRKSPYS